ncbi:MAG TPA: hypothetical protein DIS90_01305 [Cytophagales bacterium]|nr:hypothetical protein [Cytophagales bacterium]HCR53005.1 hypothetical protein [Cytophagales bacterium]
MSSKIKLFLFFLLFSTSLLGQELDTLIDLLEPLPPNEGRVDMLNRVVTQMRERNTYEAVKYASEAKELAQQLNYQKGLGLALENLGWIYYRRGIYSDAFDLSMQALNISEERGDSIAIARCLNNVAAISYEKERYGDAIKLFNRAYNIALRLGDEETAVRSLNNVSFSYLGLKKADSAEYFAKEALQQSIKTRQGYMPAFSYRILGDIAFEKGDMEEALKYFEQSMQISESTGNYFIQASTLHRIGKVYSKQKKYTKALEVLNRNVQIARKNGYADELERTYKLISDINYAKNEIALALEYLTKHLAIHDSLINQRNSERMGLLSAQFESELKQSQIELLTKNAKIREEEINRQRAWSYFYVGCFILGLAIAAILYYSNRRIKRLYFELERKTAQVETQAEQLSNINKTKDKLLSIISHDIRSPLSSLRGMLNIVNSGNVSKEEFSAITIKISNQLDAVYEDLGNLLQWTQSQLQGLSVTPESFELKDAIEEVSMLFTGSATSKKIEIINKVNPGILVSADPNHIRLILRNLLSNAIKFSGEGEKVIITSSVEDSIVTVSVHDEGIGLSAEEIPKLFDPSAHFTREGTANEKGMGVGLLLTKEFVDKNGGLLSVVSAPGKGSTFSFTLRKAS